ncbi:hypothetical protein Bpfe_031521 [Biomphalaria pfeifferi]|uniref:Uncharacterized protein n=1 Tax=Biomphalaria pfeifferi TaxID=112525 RepID=A0AAD8ANP6_BIOPF|nr:hypothetical protein Bpfe_031521 [Biomphalaria pfeifferi]
MQFLKTLSTLLIFLFTTTALADEPLANRRVVLSPWRDCEVKKFLGVRTNVSFQKDNGVEDVSGTMSSLLSYRHDRQTSNTHALPMADLHE